MVEIITIVILLVLLIIIGYFDEDVDNGELYLDLKENNHYVWANIIAIATIYNLAVILTSLFLLIEVIIGSNLVSVYHVIYIIVTYIIALIVIVASAKLFDYLYE